MMSVLMLLDEVRPAIPPGIADSWFDRVGDSLRVDAKDWTLAVGRIVRLSDEHAWSLLSWVEVAATQIVRKGSSADLTTACFALALALQSELDRRDCSLVASLLRRASQLARLDFLADAAVGCELAGSMGHEALGLLAGSSSKLPSIFLESGAGESFAFTRAEPSFDEDELERWLGGELD